MCAIEKITSKTKRIHIATAGGGEPDIIEVPVWNGTVANLTLMALGKSPEPKLQMGYKSIMQTDQLVCR